MGHSEHNTGPRIKQAFIDMHFRIYGLGEDNKIYEYLPNIQSWSLVKEGIKRIS